MALGNNPSQTDVIKAIRDLESGGSGGGVQSVTTGSTNGTLSVDGTDVAVKGLGSNAFNSTTIPTNTNQLINGAGFITSSSVPSAGTTASAVGTSASGGSASTYSKSDHIHSISGSTISSALGFTPVSSLELQAVQGLIPSSGTDTQSVINASSPNAGTSDTYARSDHQHNIPSTVIAGALALSYGGSSGSGSFSTSENTIVSFSSSTSNRIVSISVNTYSTGSHASDFFVRFGSTSGTAYGGSTSVTAGTPSDQSAQMQMSTNARHNCKTIVFAIPKNTTAYVRGKGTTSLSYRYQYTTITI